VKSIIVLEIIVLLVNAAREGLSLLEELAGTKDSRRQGGDRDGYWPGARGDEPTCALC